MMACAFAWACAARGATIDTFTGTQSGGPLTITRDAIGTSSAAETFVLGAIGLERLTRVTGTLFTDPGIDVVQAAVLPDLGVFDYASSAGGRGRVTLSYPSMGGALNANFSSDSRLRVRLTHYDFAAGAPMSVRITLEDGNDQPAVSKRLTSPGPQDVEFIFANFAQTPDLTDIDSVVVEFLPGPATDFRVSSINTVMPEPAGLTLLMVGTAAGMHRRKRPRHRTGEANSGHRLAGRR